MVRCRQLVVHTITEIEDLERLHAMTSELRYVPTVSLASLKKSVALPSFFILITLKWVWTFLWGAIRSLVGTQAISSELLSLIVPFERIVLHGSWWMFQPWQAPQSTDSRIIDISKLDLFTGTGHAILMEPRNFFFYYLRGIGRVMLQSLLDCLTKITNWI